MGIRSGLRFILLAVLLASCQQSGELPPEDGEAQEEQPAAEIASEPGVIPTVFTPIPPPNSLQPEDFTYLGAFRLPDGPDRPLTFEYGGNAMTFNPNGDPSGSSDGFPGSLVITGHDRLAYGELPDGSQVAEINIPVPAMAGSPYDLPQAAFVQNFSDVTRGFFTGLDEIPRIGMLYLDTPATGPKIHLAWGEHLNPDQSFPTHAWFDPDLSNPQMQGTWTIDDVSLYSVNGYMLEIPTDWAGSYAQGRYVGTGRYRDGGWSGMGPSLIAYRPWSDESGAPPPSSARLEATTLLLYQNTVNTEGLEGSMIGYQHADEWEGGAWITTTSGRSAVLFAGTKGTGAKYWYGYIHPAGPDQVCVEAELADQFMVCRRADGSACDPADLRGCTGSTSWWSSNFSAQFILYNPDDLARVSSGEMQPWEPQPYAAVNIDENLFHNPDGVEPDMLGVGGQRRYRIGDVAYDRANGLLYVLELFAEGAKPVVHVWRIP